MTSRKRKAAVLATRSLSAERFPSTFFTVEGRRRPLKIGIAPDICAAVPNINKEHLQWALARYCMSPGYLRSADHRRGAGRSAKTCRARHRDC